MDKLSGDYRHLLEANGAGGAMRRKISKHRYIFDKAMMKQAREDASERIRHWHDVAKDDSK